MYYICALETRPCELCITDATKAVDYFCFFNTENKRDIKIGFPGALLMISDRSSFFKLSVIIYVFSLSNIIFISGVTVKFAATIAGWSEV